MVGEHTKCAVLEPNEYPRCVVQFQLLSTKALANMILDFPFKLVSFVLMGDACCYQCFYQRQLYASKVLRQHHNHKATLYKVRILSEKTTVDSVYFFLEVRSFFFYY